MLPLQQLSNLKKRSFTDMAEPESSYTQSIEVCLSEPAGAANTLEIQLLPCSIEYDGTSKLDEYFIVTKSGDGDVRESSFRGRPLQGKEVVLPSGYSGLVLKESASSNRQDEERSMLVQHKFHKFTHWGLDHAPSANDSTQKSIGWLDISDVLHSPVTE